MASPYDLPPWLTGEQDKGFLQGAQLGITAARTGTEIAQTRQQMQESGELQPFRVAAAEIQNNLQRQQVDLNAATFVTKIRAGELENDVKAGLLTSTNLGISLKKLELEDSAIGERAQAEFIAGNREVSPIFKTAQAQSAWRLWKADTDFGHARANEQAAVKTYEASLVNQAAEQLKYGIDPYDYDREGKRSALPNVQKLQMGANAMEFKKREAAIRTASELSDITQGRQIAVQQNRLEGRLEEIDARAEAIATSKIDVGMSSLNLAQWKEKARMLREEGKLNGDFTKYRDFVNSSGNRSSVGVENPRSDQIKDAISNAEKAKTSLELQPKEKQTLAAKSVIEEQIMQGKRLLAKDEGRQLQTWDKSWVEIEKLGFKKGTEVLVPADPDSTDPIANKSEHIIVWPGNDVMKKRLDVRRIKAKQAQAQEKRDSDAAWMQQNSGWQYGRPPAF